MKKKYEATVANGKYNDSKTGEEKTSYMKVGTVFERDDGSMCLKLDAIPLYQGFNGWINFYEPKLKDLKDKVEKTPQPASAGFEDEIPFMRHEDFIG